MERQRARRSNLDTGATVRLVLFGEGLLDGCRAAVGEGEGAVSEEDG